jgi:hypothetical protein
VLEVLGPDNGQLLVSDPAWGAVVLRADPRA